MARDDYWMGSLAAPNAYRGDYWGLGPDAGVNDIGRRRYSSPGNPWIDMPETVETGAAVRGVTRMIDPERFSYAVSQMPESENIERGKPPRFFDWAKEWFGTPQPLPGSLGFVADQSKYTPSPRSWFDTLTNLLGPSQAEAAPLLRFGKAAPSAERALAETSAAERGGVAGGAGGEEGLRQARLEAERRAGGRLPLPGLPTGAQTVEGKLFIPGPVGSVHDVAERYMAGKNFGVAPPEKFYPLDKARSTAIAQEYENLPMYDPKALAAYDAMIRETLAQYQAIRQGGLKVTPVGAADYPYGSNPRAVAQDVGDRGHMAFFKTEPEAGAFGTGGETNIVQGHPLLRPSGEYVGDYPMLNNDLFRVVHDYFGHIKHGFGFRGAGEDMAWRAHAGMYSPEARPAMTSETRGQNSWVNYGPHGEFNRTASGADTIYSPQKVGLMPSWTMDDLKKLGIAGGTVAGGAAALSPGEAQASPVMSALAAQDAYRGDYPDWVRPSHEAEGPPTEGQMGKAALLAELGKARDLFTQDLPAAVERSANYYRNSPNFWFGAANPQPARTEEELFREDELARHRLQEGIRSGFYTVFDPLGVRRSVGAGIGALGSSAGGKIVQPQPKMGALADRSGIDMLQDVLRQTTNRGIIDKLPPPPRTHSERIAVRTKGMSDTDVLNSDELWAMTRDLMAQRSLPFTQAYSQLAERRLGRPLTPEEITTAMTEGARAGVATPSRYGR